MVMVRLMYEGKVSYDFGLESNNGFVLNVMQIKKLIFGPIVI